MARTWFVKDGDTWDSIATAVSVSPSELKSWNGIDPKAPAVAAPRPGTTLSASDPSERIALPVSPMPDVGALDEIVPRQRKPLTFTQLMQIFGLVALALSLVVRSGLLKYWPGSNRRMASSHGRRKTAGAAFSCRIGEA